MNDLAVSLLPDEVYLNKNSDNERGTAANLSSILDLSLNQLSLEIKYMVPRVSLGTPASFQHAKSQAGTYVSVKLISFKGDLPRQK